MSLRGGIDIRLLIVVEGYLALYAFLLVLILFHEAGHLVVGLLCGFRLVKFRVGLIELWRGDTRPQLDSLKWRISRHWRHLFSGGVSMFATARSMKHLHLRYFTFILAGPAANFVCGLVALPIAQEQTTVGGLGKYFILGSVFIGLLSLIPFTRGKLKSDGFKIWILLFNRTKRDVLLYWFTVPARLNEIRVLSRTGDIQHTCEKADEFIKMSNKLPTVMANEEYRQRLTKFQTFFQKLAKRDANAQESASKLDRQRF